MFRVHAFRRVSARAGSGALLVVAACTSNIAPGAIQNVDFRIQQDSVLNGKTYQTSVVVRDINGAEITGRKIAYESLFPLIATVDNAGLVTAKAVGGASIKASVEGRTAIAAIRVLDRVTRVVVTPLQDNVAIGQTRQMTVAVTGANGATIAGRFVRFQSSNPAVATVTAAGVVSGVSKGTTTITADAELDQVAGTATITVIDVPVASLALSPLGTQILRLGAFLQMTAVTRDAANNVLSGRVVNWSSSNPAIASVSASGLIAALAVGSATISAESEGRSASVGITVTEVPPKSVTLAPDTVALLTGNTTQLLPTVIDSLNRVVTSLATRSVLWSSSNPAVATVSIVGVVTGATAGTARVTLTVDNVRSNDVILIVTDQVQSVRLSPVLPQVMRVGNTLQITATPLNNQSQPIPGKTVSWASANPAVATVSQSGLVTALLPGTATIAAEVEGKLASLNVAVTLVPILSVTFNPDLDTVQRGASKQYSPVATDSTGAVLTSLIGRNVTWQSDAVLVATVTPVGVVTGGSQPGVAKITVTIDGILSNQLKITVP